MGTSQPAANEVNCDMLALQDRLGWQGASTDYGQQPNEQSLHNLSVGLEHQELIRNGLMPHLETMQLMRAESKRLRMNQVSVLTHLDYTKILGFISSLLFCLDDATGGCTKTYQTREKQSCCSQV